MNTRLSKLTYEAWNEIYYVLTSRLKVRLFPKRKIPGAVEKYKNRLVLIICFILSLTVLTLIHIYLELMSIPKMVTIIMLYIVAIFVLVSYSLAYRNIKKDINKRINKKSKCTNIKIDDKGIYLTKERKKVSTLEWEDISKILINKYSIIFLSKYEDVSSITISVRHKKKVLDTISKYEKDKLVIDNSDLYIEKEKKEESNNKVVKVLNKEIDISKIKSLIKQ